MACVGSNSLHTLKLSVFDGWSLISLDLTDARQHRFPCNIPHVYIQMIPLETADLTHNKQKGSKNTARAASSLNAGTGEAASLVMGVLLAHLWMQT